LTSQNPRYALASASMYAKECRRAGLTIVFTNGHFDLLHVGHLDYLEQAAQLGDVLMVGINDDASSVRLKGTGRPIVPAEERARLLAALKPVSKVFIFTGDTADEAIRAIHPHIYVKGGDYANKTLPEQPTVTEIGAQLQLIDYLPNHSTTQLIAKIQSLPQGQ
jgi:rfaE bifunctional protein nucleotidyltransferase chain/domain